MIKTASTKYTHSNLFKGKKLDERVDVIEHQENTAFTAKCRITFSHFSLLLSLFSEWIVDQEQVLLIVTSTTEFNCQHSVAILHTTVAVTQ